jgi:hypothetical protein
MNSFGWRHLEVMSFSMSMSMSMSAYIPSDTGAPTISPSAHPSSPPTISPSVSPSGTPTEVNTSSPSESPSGIQVNTSSPTGSNAAPVSGLAITCDGAQVGANSESVEIEFSLATETASDSSAFYEDLQSTMINFIAENLDCVAPTIARHLELESFTPLALEVASEESPTKSEYRKMTYSLSAFIASVHLVAYHFPFVFYVIKFNR